MARSRPQPRNQIKPLGMTRINLGFMCESAEFNGAVCQTQCKRCKPKRKPRFDLAAQVKKLGADSLLPPARKPRALRITKPWFEDYCIRVGDDGKPGIYLREFNVRLATFNANTQALQTRLSKLFDTCRKTGKE